MSRATNADIYLCLTLLAFIPLAIWRIPQQLLAVRKAVETDETEEVSGLPSKQHEDAVRLETLAQLARSPNVTLRDAASSILKNRLIKSDSTWGLLLEMLASPDSKSHHDALQILRFILPHEPFSHSTELRWWQPEFLSALVTCLRHLLPESYTAIREERYLPEQQMIALEIVSRMLKNPSQISLNRFVDAGLISRWLNLWPFNVSIPSDLPQRPRRAEVVRYIATSDDTENWRPDELKEILQDVLMSPFGRACMANSGLWDYAFEARIPVSDRPIAIEKSTQDVILRRRRREAFVMGEEGRPIESGDIVQEGDDLTGSDVEELLSRLQVEQAAANHGLPVNPSHSPENTERWMQSNLPLP